MINKSKVQKTLLEQLSKMPIIQVACDKSGVSRATFYRMCKESKKFKGNTDKAIQQGRLLINDMAETQIISAIKDRNITGLIYWLNHNHPLYKTRIEIEANHKINNGKISKEQEALIKKAIGLMIPNNSKKGSAQDNIPIKDNE
ncbi:MAG TPA: hypothetical protein P5096_00835 [Patescibacteria group bacterium]|nr:hypothetical protein [Patescibacteria group bacterium]